MIIGQDLFTEGSDLALPSHISNLGASFDVEDTNFTVISATGDVRHTGTVTNRARKGDNLGSDQHVITADVNTAVNTTRISGVCARMSLADFSHQFEATIERTNTSTKTLRLWKNNGGGAGRVEIGSGAVALSFGDGVFMTMQLVIGDGIQAVLINGVSQITATEPGTTFAGNQYGGFIMNGNNSLVVRVDNFLSEVFLNVANPGYGSSVQVPPMVGAGGMFS